MARSMDDLMARVFKILELRYDAHEQARLAEAKHIWTDGQRDRQRESDVSGEFERFVACRECQDEGSVAIRLDGKLMRALCDCPASSKWKVEGEGKFATYVAIFDASPQQGRPAYIARPSYTDPEELREARSPQAPLTMAADDPLWDEQLPPASYYGED